MRWGLKRGPYIAGSFGPKSAIDEVPGHLSIARENVARSLTALVDDGTLNTDRAKEIAGWLFWDNPNSMFPLAKGSKD